MHPNVSSHTAQSVAFVTADLASESLDSLMGVHVALGGTGRRTNGATDRTSPATCGTAGAGMAASGFYYRLRYRFIKSPISRKIAAIPTPPSSLPPIRNTFEQR